MNIGDTVVLTSDRYYKPDIKIPQGSAGVILRIINYGTWIGYFVSFFGYNQTRIVSGNYLVKA